MRWKKELKKSERKIRSRTISPGTKGLQKKKKTVNWFILYHNFKEKDEKE